jgi:hypothetical protein
MSNVGSVTVRVYRFPGPPFDSLLLPHEHETNIEATVREFGGKLRLEPDAVAPSGNGK